jgi:hypothetical protein
VKHRLTDAALLVMTALGVALLACLWLLVRPYDNVSFTGFTADAQTYAAGDVVELSNTFCWDGTPFRADRWLVGAVSEQSLGTVRFPNGYAIEPVRVRYVDGCEPSTVKVQLPETTPPGEYRIRYDVTYAVPLKEVRVSNVSTAFTVTAP